MKLVPDADAALKDWLHDFYYAQQDYRKKHGKYAAKTDDLGDKFTGKTAWGEAKIETSARGFTATAGEKKRRWSIAQDSHLTKE